MATTERFSETISSDLQAAERVQDRIISLLESMEFEARDVFGMRLALEEAIVNAIKHGNGMDPSKSVEIECEIGEERALVVVTDEGTGFDPMDIPDPTEADNLEKPGGRGIMLMKAFMTRVEYNDRGNQVVLEKIRENGEESDD